jgi:fatty-acyl-CoA synthase
MIDWWGPILLEYYSGSEGVGLTLIDSTRRSRIRARWAGAARARAHRRRDGAELPRARPA